MSSSVPPARKIAWGVIGGMSTAIGGALVATFMNWYGGIVTAGELEQATKAVAAAARADHELAIAHTEQRLRGILGHPNSDNPGPLYPRLQELEFSRLMLTERLGVETRARVGYQVELYYAADPKRRAAAAKAARAARASFDDLVLRLPPEAAAERALERAGVPR